MIDYDAKTTDGRRIYGPGSCGLPANKLADPNCKKCNGDGILDAGDFAPMMVNCDCCALQTEQQAVLQMPLPKGTTRDLNEALVGPWYIVAILAEAISAMQQYPFAPVKAAPDKWVAAMYIASIPFYMKKVAPAAEAVEIPLSPPPDHRSHHGAQADYSPQGR